MTTTTHTYPLTEAITAAQAILPHTSTDDITLVLVAAKLVHDYWIATDRYTIGKWEIDHGSNESPHHVETPPTHETLIPREAVEWVAKLQTNKLRHAKQRSVSKLPLYALHVTQQWHDPKFYGGDPMPGDVTLAIVIDGNIERSQQFDAVSGTFPPIERIVDNWKPAVHAHTSSLDPAKLERVTAFAKRHEKYAPILLEPGETERDPVRITYNRLTALIQPNLKLK